MPMRYANSDDVYAALKIDPDSIDPLEVAVLARIVRLENGLADNFDQEVNTSFGVAATAEMRAVWSTGAYVSELGSWTPEYAFYDYGWPYRRNRAQNQMILNTRIRTLTAIRTGGDWDGTTWLDDELVPVGDYALNHQDSNGGYWGIQSLTGTWNGVYRITGVWADQSTLTVPNDVREALTFLTIDQYRVLESSPSGSLGPDGLMVQTRNPWSYRSVKNSIDRHRVIELVV